MDIEDLGLLIDEPLAKLNLTLVNFQKAPNRAYSKRFLVKKINQARKFYNIINDTLAENEGKFPKAELNFLIKAARQKFNDILLIANEKLVFANDQITSLRTIGIIFLFYIKLKRKRTKMAAVPTVDVKLGTSLISVYDGKPENLDAFIDAVRLFEDTVNQTFADGTPAQKAAAAQTVVRFVRTRLTDKARQTINENQNLDEMLVAIRAHCESKISADSLIAKLKTVRQNGDLTEFCDKVDRICSQLKSVYLRDEIPQVTATKMSTKCGIEALIRGANNNDAKIILKAGSFDKLSDAIQKLMENSSPTNQILTASRVNQQNRGRMSNSYRGNGRGQSHTNRGHQNNYPRNNYSRGNYNNYRGNSHNRGYRNGRGYYQSRGSFSHRGHPNHQGMFLMAQQQFPQQIPQIQQNLQGYPQNPINIPGSQQNFLDPPQGQFSQ